MVRRGAMPQMLRQRGVTSVGVDSVAAPIDARGDSSADTSFMRSRHYGLPLRAPRHAADPYIEDVSDDAVET